MKNIYEIDYLINDMKQTYTTISESIDQAIEYFKENSFFDEIIGCNIYKLNSGDIIEKRYIIINTNYNDPLKYDIEYMDLNYPHDIYSFKHAISFIKFIIDHYGNKFNKRKVTDIINIDFVNDEERG